MEKLKLDEETKKAVRDLAASERKGLHGQSFHERERKLYGLIAERYGKEVASQVLRRLWVYSAGIELESDEL